MTRTDPDRALDVVLRTEVGRFRAEQSRRRFAPAVHVGRLGGPRRSATLEVDRSGVLAAYDHGLRTDLVASLLDAAGGSAGHTWLTRPGAPAVHDLDLAWLAAARDAFARVGRPPPGCFALTRGGWLDVATGRSRQWKRLRL